MSLAVVVSAVAGCVRVASESRYGGSEEEEGGKGSERGSELHLSGWGR